MMGNEKKSIRCSINKTLSFDGLQQELNAQLDMNSMSGVVEIIRENANTFRLTSHNYGLEGVKHTFKMVCDKVDSNEAKARGDWTAHHPPVEIRWFEEQGHTKEELTRQLDKLREQRTIDQKALDRARTRATPRTPGSQQWVGVLSEDMRKLQKRIADLEAEIEKGEVGSK